ncbi:MAG TPA: helix-turn-helix domain-containing protein [Pseudonocardia sp.]|jgi:DNA-binding HxlR family transcriptional regulator
MPAPISDSCAGARDAYSATCPCRELLDLLANKWSALALGALEDGPRRFGVLRSRLDGISPKMLTQTLRRLEELGLVNRVVYPSVPLHVEYSLTPLGRDACVPLTGLRVWVERNVDRIPSMTGGARQ